MSKNLSILLGALVFWFPFQLFAFVRAKVENTKVSENQVITLIIETDQAHGEPRLEALSQNFKIVGSGHASQVDMMNGTVRHQLTYTFSLLPKRSPTGTNSLSLLIPPIVIGNEQSEPITLEVYPAGQRITEGINNPIFVKGDLSAHSARPGEQLVYTFQLYITPQALRGIAQPYLKQPEQPGLEWVPLGDPTQREERQDGLLYEVLEQKFALFVHQEGEIEVPGVMFSALAQDGRHPYTFIAETHPLQLSAASEHLTIKPFPAEIGQEHPLVASSLSVEEEWSMSGPVSGEPLKVGELMTRTVHLKALNAQSDGLPEMPVLSLDKVNVYPSPPVRESHVDNGRLVAKSSQKIAYMFTEAGEYSLPESRFSYWNSNNQRMETVTLPARSVRVERLIEPSVSRESLNLVSAPNKTLESPSDSFWKWVVLGVVVLWIFSLVVVVWVLKGKKKQGNVVLDETPLTKMSGPKRMKQAIRVKNYTQLAACLVEWGNEELNVPVRSLGDLIEVVREKELQEWLQTLEKILYHDAQPNLDLNKVLALLKQEKRSIGGSKKLGFSLPEFYKN